MSNETGKISACLILNKLVILEHMKINSPVLFDNECIKESITLEPNETKMLVSSAVDNKKVGKLITIVATTQNPDIEMSVNLDRRTQTGTITELYNRGIVSYVPDKLWVSRVLIEEDEIGNINNERYSLRYDGAVNNTHMNLCAVAIKNKSSTTETIDIILERLYIPTGTLASIPLDI